MFNIHHDFTEVAQVQVLPWSLLARRLLRDIKLGPGIEMVSITTSSRTLTGKTITVKIGGSDEAKVAEAMVRASRLMLVA